VFNAYLYTSTDSGVTWTLQTSSTSQFWSSVASSADGTHLVAAVYGGYLYTSTNSGVTWTQQTGSTSQYWQSVASSADGTHLVAAAQGGYIYTSTNSGVTWTQQTGSTSQSWQSVASSADGTHLVAAVSGGYIYTSQPEFVGTAGTTVQFQYQGNGVWQPMEEAASQIVGTIPTTQLSGTLTTAQLPAALVTNNETGVTLSGTFTGNGSGLTGLSASALPSAVVTNNETGVTLGGTFSGNGSGLTGLSASALPSTVLTNNETGVTLSGTFSGSSLTLNNGPNLALNVQGSSSGGITSEIGLIQNNYTGSGESAPALRVVGYGNTSNGALSVSAQGTGLIAQFGNSSSFVSQLETNGIWTATAFNTTSDKNVKENFTPVDAQAVLAKVAALPISRWNFTNSPAVPHVGPMAQDFYHAFNVGADDRHIATVDEDGVALAAIQGLNQKLEEEKAENAELKARMEKLEQLMTEKLGGTK